MHPECYYVALKLVQDFLGFESISDGFKFRRMWRTTDGDKSISKIKRYFGNLESRISPAIASFSHNCQIHSKNTDRIEAFKICESVTSRIRIAILSVTFANHRKYFRCALREELSKVHVERNEAPSLHRREEMLAWAKRRAF